MAIATVDGIRVSMSVRQLVSDALADSYKRRGARPKRLYLTTTALDALTDELNVRDLGRLCQYEGVEISACIGPCSLVAADGKVVEL